MTRSMKLGTALTLSFGLMVPAMGVAQSTEADETLCVEIPEDENRGQVKKFVSEAELPICGIEDDPEVRALLEEAGVELPPLDEAADEAAETLETMTEEAGEAAEEVEAEAAEVEAEAEAAQDEAAEALETVTEEPAAEEVEAAVEEAEAAAEEAAAEAEAAAAEVEAEAEAAAEEAEVAEEAETAAGETSEEAPAEEAPAQAEVDTVEEEILPEIDEEAAAAREATRRERRAERQAAREARRAERRAEREAAAALAATDPDAEPAAEAEVETEEVTEETARSSDESFEEVAEERAQARAGRDDDGNDRLKAILGAAAAAAAVIGAILDNGDEVVETTDDRVIVRRDGEYVVLKDENELLRRPGSQVSTETFADGSTRTFVTRENGSRIMTIRDADGVVLYRSRIAADGTEVVLIDDTEPLDPIDFEELPSRADTEVIEYSAADEDVLRRALRQEELRLDRAYTLQQVREVKELRELMPQVDLDSITFDTGSAAIRPEQARSLISLGRAMAEMIEDDPDELFLIEGHTDSVGSELSNLALSDRRAESVALALAEYFDVPPENLIVQGYGEQFLKIDLEGDIRANRRATVRRITPLLRSASLQ